jgi:hypothetical protein
VEGAGLFDVVGEVDNDVLTVATISVAVSDPLSLGQRGGWRTSSLATAGSAVAEVREHNLRQCGRMLIEADYRTSAIRLTHMIGERRAGR